jgi:hypothetical protein
MVKNIREPITKYFSITINLYLSIVCISTMYISNCAINDRNKVSNK